MAVRITHVRFSSTTEKTHRTITNYKWTDLNDDSTGSTPKELMVDWIDKRGGEAVVGVGAAQVNVGVVRQTGSEPYLRTYADGKWSNNLLSLPVY